MVDRPRPIDFIDTEERIIGHATRGYHPPRLGELLHDQRYKLHHKLGHGRFSTVWLARAA